MDIEPLVERDVTILCPMCGVQFHPKLSNICQACVLAKTDITIGITKEAIINFCRFCHRYMRPPWVACSRDSKELLAILLKKIKGLNKAKITNAGFIYTEEHSKRIKVKVTIEKELNNKTKVEQTFITEFIECYMQCDDCKKQFTPHTWEAVVQVRQHVDHKKTFYYIEQLIIKHQAYDKLLKISEADDGINFYYKTKPHAERLINFLSEKLPLTRKDSKQLISHDQNSNQFVYKYTYSIEIPKVCRNDLVLLPKKLARQLGGCSQLVLCWKVAKTIGFVDLNTFNYVNMSTIQYQHYEKDMQILPLNRYKRQFQVLDSNPCEKNKFHTQKSTLNKLINKMYMYNITRRGQWQNVEIKAPLGDIPCGHLLQGFDLRYLSYTEEIAEIKGLQDIILVRRFKERSSKGRGFKLKNLQEEIGMVNEDEGKKKSKKKNNEKQDQAYEEFVDDVQADPNLRKQMKLYENSSVLKKNMTKQELDEILGDIEIEELFRELKIEEKEEKGHEGEQLQGIDDLIAKMENVKIQRQ